MEWTWAVLSVIGAFGQALGWGLKKKALNNSGVNNTTGLVSYGVAGALLLGLSLVSGGVAHLTTVFWVATLFVVLLNVLAAWTGYRAVDKGDLSTLMPFMALTALAIVPIEYLLRETLPTPHQLCGMIIVVLGAFISAWKSKPTKASLAVAGYFGVTLACYSITSPLMGVAVNEAGSGLRFAAIMHVGIAIGFVFLCLISREWRVIKELKHRRQWVRTLWWMVLAGIVIALFENGPINIALETATASEVFALKRTMPFFALMLGVMMFGERVTRWHIIGTAFLVLGSVLIVWFK